MRCEPGIERRAEEGGIERPCITAEIGIDGACQLPTQRRILRCARHEPDELRALLLLLGRIGGVCPSARIKADGLELPGVEPVDKLAEMGLGAFRDHAALRHRFEQGGGIAAGVAVRIGGERTCAGDHLIRAGAACVEAGVEAVHHSQRFACAHGRGRRDQRVPFLCGQFEAVVAGAASVGHDRSRALDRHRGG